MLDRFAHSPNQGIVKRFAVEDSQTTRQKRLVVAAQHGSREAFGELCQPRAKLILQKVQRITRNREDPEDALQDSFLMAFVHIKDFDGRSKFSTWSTRIAINLALMILRKRHHSAEFSLSDEEVMVFGKYRINFRIPKSSTRNESEKAFYWPQSGTCDQVTGKCSSVD